MIPFKSSLRPRIVADHDAGAACEKQKPVLLDHIAAIITLHAAPLLFLTNVLA
jgi:hypothetical protein